MFKKILSQKEGSALVTTVVIIVLVTILSTSLLSLALFSLKNAYISSNRQQAYFTARSSALAFKDYLSNYSNFKESTFTGDLTDQKMGTFKITLQEVSFSTKLWKITSYGTYNGEQNMAIVYISDSPFHPNLYLNNNMVTAGTALSSNSGNQAMVQSIAFDKANPPTDYQNPSDETLKTYTNLFAEGDYELELSSNSQYNGIIMSKGNIKLKSAGKIKCYGVRTLKNLDIPGSGYEIFGDVFVGGNFTMTGDNLTIHGNLYASGNVTLSNNTKIDGKVICNGTYTKYNAQVTGGRDYLTGYQDEFQKGLQFIYDNATKVEVNPIPENVKNMYYGTTKKMLQFKYNAACKAIYIDESGSYWPTVAEAKTAANSSPAPGFDANNKFQSYSDYCLYIDTGSGAAAKTIDIYMPPNSKIEMRQMGDRFFEKIAVVGEGAVRFFLDDKAQIYTGNQDSSFIGRIGFMKDGKMQYCKTLADKGAAAPVFKAPDPNAYIPAKLEGLTETEIMEKQSKEEPNIYFISPYKDATIQNWYTNMSAYIIMPKSYIYTQLKESKLFYGSVFAENFKFEGGGGVGTNYFVPPSKSVFGKNLEDPGIIKVVKDEHASPGSTPGGPTYEEKTDFVKQDAKVMVSQGSASSNVVKYKAFSGSTAVPSTTAPATGP